MGPGKLVQYIPPQEHHRMRAKLNTRYVTAGLVYELDVWTKNGLVIVQFMDRLGKTRTQWYHTRDEFNEEWEEL